MVNGIKAAEGVRVILLITDSNDEFAGSFYMQLVILFIIALVGGHRSVAQQLGNQPTVVVEQPALMPMIASSNNPDISSIPSIKIGDQEWMRQNLSVDHFQNGDSINEVRGDELWKWCHETRRPAWCHYNNDPAMSEKYGRLYNYWAVVDPRGLAPEGWKIPTTGDWRTLAAYAGVENLQGYRLKDSIGWCSGGNGSNLFGFEGKPAGKRVLYGYFQHESCESHMWTNETYNHVLRTWSFRLGFNSGWVAHEWTETGDGLSVRCIKVAATGIHDETPNAGDVIFPNPVTSSIITIESTESIDVRAGIMVIDALGRIVDHVRTISGNRITFEVAQLSAGTYQVVYSTASGTRVYSFTKLM